MDEETQVAIEGLDKRLQTVEAIILAKRKNGKNTVVETEQGYKGLKGGIALLIDEHFFDAPKSKLETKQQLAQKGYHHPEGAVQAALARDFMKRKRILTRIKEGGKYKYVMRK